MQTDIKILVRLHHSLVLVFFGFFSVRGQRLNLSLSLRVVIRSMCFRAWITVQFESQGRPLDGLMLGGGGGEKTGSTPPPDTYLSLLRHSQIQKPDWSDHPAGSLGGPARLSLHLHLNLPFI